jgi:hypothetical protein
MFEMSAMAGSPKRHRTAALLLTAAWVVTGGGSVDAQTCPVGAQPRNVGTAYRYSQVGINYRLTVYRKPNQVRVGYRNERTDGSWSEIGSINRWPKCPTANISVQLIDSKGKSTVCTRVCLPDGREELHCPGKQLVMTRLSELQVCVNANAAEAGSTVLTQRDPEPRPRPCKFRIGCQDYDTCVSCCAEDGNNIVECGLGCLFAGADVGTDRCTDPFPPSGGTDAISCVAISGYPNWCDRELPAF